MTRTKGLTAKDILYKWDDNIKIQLSGEKIIVLIPYCEEILEFFKAETERNKEFQISSVVAKNLTNFLQILPQEVVACFWLRFNQEQRRLSEAWFNSFPENGNVIIRAIARSN